jgi:RNA polymerase sigma-70 factor (ECF subfamily)
LEYKGKNVMNHSRTPSTQTAGGAGEESPEDYYATVKQLFREHNQALVKFLRTRLPSQQDAMDVAQECYVRLLQLDRPGAVGFLRGYLFRVAANLAVDRMRRLDVRAREGIELFDEFSEGSLVDRQAITDQEVRSVAEALKRLPPRAREAFVLHMVEGYGTAEIAARMKVRDRQVRRYIAQALRFCQDWLEGDHETRR